jgi:hypothetical protein
MYLQAYEVEPPSAYIDNARVVSFDCTHSWKGVCMQKNNTVVRTFIITRAPLQLLRG